MKIIAGNPWLLICARFVAGVLGVFVIVVVVVVVSVVAVVVVSVFAYYKRSEFYRPPAVPLFIIYESLFGMKAACVLTV